MSSTILDGAVVKKNAMLAAGSLLTQGKIVKSGEIWSGNPAKSMRKLSIKEIEFFKISADRYFKMSQEYLANFNYNN